MIQETNSKNYCIEIREDPEPFLARIIITDEWDGNPKDAKRLLEDIYNKWPKDKKDKKIKKVKFLITCGGFIHFDWPDSVTKEDIGDNLNPKPDAIKILVEEAEKCIRSVLTENLRNKLKNVTDYITIGIDSHKEKISDLSKEKTQNYISKPHIELVFLIDLKNNKFPWTGKSYPTSEQERGLVRITDLESHFVGKVMILGCHDLNIFNPRSDKNAKGWRKKVKEDFKELAKTKKPIIVLHHPHTTVKVKTWLNAWCGLRELLPSVEKYAGAGRYHESWRDPLEYDDLDDVLKSTKYGDTLDFIVETK